MPDSVLRLPHAALAIMAALFLTIPAFAQFQPSAPAEAPPESDRADYSTLADVLENEATRNALIADLRRLAAEEGVAVESPAAQMSIARQIANATHVMAETIVSEVGEAFERIVNIDLRDVSSQGMQDLTQAFVDLGGVIIAAIIVMWLLRWLASGVYQRMSEWVLAARANRLWLKRSMAALACSFIDVAIVAVGWVAGYVVALLALGTDPTSMDTRQSLFLNAFLVIESIKVVIRFFFATRYDGLRILTIRGEDAAYWNMWLSRLTSFIGYGLLVIVPIVNVHLGTSVGSVVSVLIHVMALLLVVILVRQNRELVSGKLTELSQRSRFGAFRLIFATLAGVWHIIAIVYFTVLTIMLVIHPETALSFIMAATVQSVLVLLAGVLLSMLIDRAIALGVRLKPSAREQFPMLEERLNAFVPTTLKVVRIVISILVVVLVLHAWQAFDFFAWLTSESGMNFVGTVMTIAFILVLSVGIWLLVSSWIEHRLKAGDDGIRRASSARERTLLTIFRNAFTIALVVIASMITLSELGLDIAPLLAGAGVLGLAIGFGAQKLVQDVITGVFIQLENAMNAGDIVTAGAITGTVEKLTVRSVGIRDLEGTYHLIPFSSVDTVSNFMRGFGYHVGHYRIGYWENVDHAIEVLKAAFEELRADPDYRDSIIGDLEVFGVTELGETGTVIRVRIMAVPGMQWAVGRAYNGVVKAHFSAAGIEIPFPHMKLYFGQDKEGHAPAAPVHLTQDTVEGSEPDSGKAGAETSSSAPRASTASRTTNQGKAPDIPSEDDV